MGKKRKAEDSEILKLLLCEFKKLRQDMNALAGEDNQENQEEPVNEDGENGDEGKIDDDDKKEVDSEEEDGKASSSSEDEKEKGLAPQKPLEQDIAMALGDDPTNVNAENVSLHNDVAKRWLHWHANGLPKEEKESLLKRYPCMEGFEVPALNPELAAKIHESTLKRDEHMMERQKIASSALTIVGSLMSEIIHETEGLDKVIIVEKLNDTAKLLNQLMLEQTNTRKAIVLPGIDKKYKTLLESASTDKYLFGNDLSERIKAANAIEKVGENIKIQPKKPLQQRNNLNYNSLQARKPPYGQAGNRSYQGPPRTRVFFKKNQQPFNPRVNNQSRFRPKQQSSK